MELCHAPSWGEKPWSWLISAEILRIAQFGHSMAHRPIKLREAAQICSWSQFSSVQTQAERTATSLWLRSWIPMGYLTFRTIEPRLRTMMRNIGLGSSKSMLWSTPKRSFLWDSLVRTNIQALRVHIIAQWASKIVSVGLLWRSISICASKPV